MATLEERMADSPHLEEDVYNLSLSNREVGRRHTVDESVIRRFRARMMADPQSPAADVLPVIGKTTQWVPGVDLSEDRGEARSLPVPVEEARDLSDDDLLRSMSIDPEKWQITSRKDRRWQNASGEWLSANNVEVIRRGSTEGDLSVEQMTEILGEYAGREGLISSVDENPHRNRIFVVPLADLQAGKKDGGGTAALIDRFGRAIQEVRDRLLREGYAETIVIPVLGDCIEGFVHQGGRLITRLDISVTEQVRVYRRLLLHAIGELSPYADHVIIPVLPGNHDESYRIVDQPVTDSWAIEGASAVQDALEMSGRYEHVRFVYPGDEELVISVNVGTAEKPFVLGFTHGHLVKAPNSTAAWWSGQAFGKQHGGNADLLFTGHFHHLRVENMGSGRTWFQAPALDSGSEYYKRAHGSEEPTGIISLWVTPGKGIGWEGLVFHTGE